MVHNVALNLKPATQLGSDCRVTPLKKFAKNCFLFFAVCFLMFEVATQVAHAANWSGVINPNRGTDWSQAGVQGGIPTNRTKFGSTIGAGSSAVTINTALSNATANTYVELGAGTFNLSATINLRSNVTLRGQGMSTILNFTNVGGSGWCWGDWGIAIAAKGTDCSGQGAAPGSGGVTTSTIRNFTGTNGQAGVYTQGATVLNLSSAPTGLTAGMMLVLWQTDVADGSLPNGGYFVSDKTGASNAISWQGSADSFNSGHQQRVKVISITGSEVTVSPGLYRPTGTWQTALAPKAGWRTSTLTGVGLENLRAVNSTNTILHFVGFDSVADSWISGVGLMGGANLDNVLALIDSRNITVKDNWWGPAAGGGVYTTTTYGISQVHCSGCLIQNNIFNGVESPIMLNMGTTGTVVAYNFENYTTGEGGLQAHQEGGAMNLFEGNSFTKFWSDFFHGNTVLNTLYRNHLTTQGIDLNSYHRWYNAIGNVINASTYESYCNTPPLFYRWAGVAFRLGYPQQNADCSTTSGVAFDTQVRASLMRWGNYVTTGGTRWLCAEVPTGDALFPNTCPGPDGQASTLPSSFYLSSRPPWWPTAKAWPPIGPDVTGGNLTGYAGHAYTLPAQDCYTLASGNVANFIPALCYVVGGGGDTIPPNPPTNLTVQ